MFGWGAKKEIRKLQDGLKEASDKISILEGQNSARRQILENMVEGVISVNSETRITSVNPSGEKIFGIKKNDAEGALFLEALPNNDLAELIDRVIRTGEAVSRELVLAWPVQKTFQINASPIFERNRIHGCLLVIHDITEIRRLEAIRKDFVANVSHELKTPLTSIKGFVETLIEGALEDKENSRHFLRIIEEHVTRIDNLVNDLLDLSYFESKAVRLQKQPLDIKELVDGALAGFKSQLKKSSISARNELPAGLSMTLNRDKMRQVFTNLIDNAIKFNRENGTVRIYSRDLGAQVEIAVEDSGIGISPKDIPRIFERFYRVDKARSRELGGTGLGLSIVKHIIELHGGSVGVESTEGLGSKFYFFLPK